MEGNKNLVDRCLAWATRDLVSQNNLCCFGQFYLYRIFSEVMSWSELYQLSRGWCLPLFQNWNIFGSLRGINNNLKELKSDNQLKQNVTLPCWVQVAHVCAQGLFILLLFPETLSWSVCWRLWGIWRYNGNVACWVGSVYLKLVFWAFWSLCTSVIPSNSLGKIGRSLQILSETFLLQKKKLLLLCSVMFPSAQYPPSYTVCA